MAVSRQSLRVVPESFGSLLRRKRRTDGLTQTQLANQFGVQQQTIAAWEQDNRPKTSYIGKLARYLGMVEKELVLLIDTQSALSLAQPEASEEASESADLMMRQLAKSYMEADQKGRLSPEAAKTYGKLVDYFGRMALKDLDATVTDS